jgi:excinuclease ABC subunit A
VVSLPPQRPELVERERNEQPTTRKTAPVTSAVGTVASRSRCTCSRILSRPIAALCDVGLGYLKLGQPATELSGGEAQRVKLAEGLLARRKKCIYVLDEPTTGLHMADVEKLVTVFDRLADEGNTVILVEHHLDVIRHADFVVDMGPEGGDAGGRIVASGTPEKVAKVKGSATGACLREMARR